MPATNEVLRDGRYKLNHQFPVNDHGIVFDAYDTVSNTKVLVKEIVVRMNRVTTPAQQEQLKTAFANQAKVLTSIKHDTLINVHDFFSETGRQFLVMEALEGNELSDIISREGKGLAVESVVRWTDQLLDGLNYLHTFQPSIVHKNIRPENIKLTADNRVKLLAFGLVDGSDTRISTSMSGGDDADISYSPLEQVWESLDSASQRIIADSFGEQEEKMLRQPLDVTSDIYSLGATLYHLLTGTKPVSALERAIEVLDGNADPLPSPSSINPAVPESVSKLIATAMQVKRTERFRSSAQMRETLRSVFPLNDLDAKSSIGNAANDRAPKEEIQFVAPSAPAVQKTAATTAIQENQTQPPPTPAATPVEEFHPVLLVDQEGSDGSELYTVEPPATVKPETRSPQLEESEIEPFTYGSAKNGSSMSMAAVAGGVALLLVIAVGAWFALSSGSPANTPSDPVQSQLAAQPSQPSPEPEQPEPAAQQAADPVEQASPEIVSQQESATSSDPGTSRSAKPTAGKSPRPASGPAKDPAKKKALTVDDLIRDN